MNVLYHKLTLLIAATGLAMSATAQTVQPIYWEKERVLTWKDFVAPAEMQSAMIAATTSGISLNWKTSGDTLTAKIVATMNPAKSWVKPGRQTDALLGHEQLHFDISEIAARRLRKIIAEGAFDTADLKRSMRLLLFAENSLMTAEQSTYDAETKHGLVVKRQELWQQDVHNRLDSLANYTQTEVRFIMTGRDTVEAPSD